MELILMLAGAIVAYKGLEFIYSRSWSKGLSADIRFSDKFVASGEQAFIYETVVNRKWMPLHLINVKFQLDRNISFEDQTEEATVTDKLYKNEAFSIMFYKKITRKIPIVCKKRGYYTIDSLDVISNGLFMNDISLISTHVDADIVVYPKQVDMMLEVPYKRIMGEIITKRFTYEDPFEFKGIRDYQTYDTMDRINWKAAAKTGELKVNINEFTASQEVFILLNLEDGRNVTFENMAEESISIADTLMRRLLNEGVTLSILSNGKDVITGMPLEFIRRSGLEQINSITTGLSRIDINQKPEDFAALIASSTEILSNQALYVMISNSKNTRLVEAYNSLAAINDGAIWIHPYYPDEEPQVRGCSSGTVIPWEVPYYD